MKLSGGKLRALHRAEAAGGRPAEAGRGKDIANWVRILALARACRRLPRLIGPVAPQRPRWAEVGRRVSVTGM